jgi:hypothetical protein
MVKNSLSGSVIQHELDIDLTKHGIHYAVHPEKTKIVVPMIPVLNLL